MPSLTPNQDTEVSISEQGTLVDERVTGDNIVGETDFDIDVPLGKLWNIKFIAIYTSKASSKVKIYAWKDNSNYCILRDAFTTNNGDQISTEITNLSLPYEWGIKVKTVHGEIGSVTVDVLTMQRDA